MNDFFRLASRGFQAARDQLDGGDSDEKSSEAKKQADAQGADAAVRRMVKGPNDPWMPGTEVYSKSTVGGVSYHHAGVYIGNGEVVHVHATPKEAAQQLVKGRTLTRVKRSSIAGFQTDGDAPRKGPHATKFTPDETVERAVSHVGEGWMYDLANHNCQHFASEVVSGTPHSPERDKFDDAVQAALRSMGIKVGNRSLGSAIGSASHGLTSGLSAARRSVKNWF